MVSFCLRRVQPFEALPPSLLSDLRVAVQLLGGVRSERDRDGGGVAILYENATHAAPKSARGIKISRIK